MRSCAVVLLWVCVLGCAGARRKTGELVDRHGAVWAGTAGSGVNRLERDRFTHYRMAEGLGSDAIFSLFEDRDAAAQTAERDIADDHENRARATNYSDCAEPPRLPDRGRNDD